MMQAQTLRHEYRKHTRLWHSRAVGQAFRPQPVCCAASPRPAVAADGVHPMMAQRGGSRATRRGYSQAQLYSMPPSLCDEIAQAAESCNQSEE